MLAIGYAPSAEELRMFVSGLIGNFRIPPALLMLSIDGET